MPKKTKVLIVDDHRVVREGLSAILETKDDIQVVGEAKDGGEAVEQARALLPDVILMDVSMPGMTGIEATRIIKREFPHIGVVALTMYEEQRYIFDLVRAGATGYLLKDCDSAQIIAAIRTIAKGESLIHPSVASKILAEFSLLSEGKGKKTGDFGTRSHRTGDYCFAVSGRWQDKQGNCQCSGSERKNRQKPCPEYFP